MFLHEKNFDGCEAPIPSRSDATLMKKTRSVDFSRMSMHASQSRNSTAASQFSQRAARGSFKDLRSPVKSPLESYSSDCSLNRKRNHSSNPYAEADPLRIPAPDGETWSTSENGVEHEPPRTQFSISIPRFSLAKLSIIFLAFATICDMALTKMSNNGVGRPRASLGSAAISAVTDTLSPILPFAGGLDLRRDDYWSVSADGNWFGTLQSVVVQVQDAFARKEETNGRANRKSRESAGNPLQTMQAGSRPPTTRQPKKQELAISAQQPFVKLDTIAQLTLGDIGTCFQFAVMSSQVDFNLGRFASEFSPSLRIVVQGMQDSISRSRGSDFRDWIRQEGDMDGTADALKFAAAMRVFAEWRMLRQVPPGYKGFAMGMSLGHKDVVQNIVKIEEAVHGWLEYQQELCLAGDDEDCIQNLRTPTLQELLQHEIDTGVQTASRLPSLREKSAGMGLLWVRRQLAYQTQIFDNVLNMNGSSGEKVSMKDAVGAAYLQVYGQYHGWAVQKIFNYSFQAAPEAEEILRFMNPHRLSELQLELRGSHEGVGSDNHRGRNENENPVQQLLNHIGGEWDKFAFGVVKFFNKGAEPSFSVHTTGNKSVDDDSSGVDEDYITREMVKDAHIQIESYLTVTKPLLKSLATLFADLNMDDPTRV